MVDARLLGELPLRHFLGLQLGAKPLVECTAIGAGHGRIIRGARISPYPPFVHSNALQWGTGTRGFRGVVCGARPCGVAGARGLRTTEVPFVDTRAAHPRMFRGIRRYAGVGEAWTPRPRRFDDSAYTTEPMAMIESTLMARSTSVIASASVSGTP